MYVSMCVHVGGCVCVCMWEDVHMPVLSVSGPGHPPLQQPGYPPAPVPSPPGCMLVEDWSSPPWDPDLPWGLF